MTIRMRDDNPFEEYCPNCGKYTGGDSICPNCGNEIYDEEGMDEYDNPDGDDSGDEAH